MLILDPATRKVMWKKKLKELQEKHNKIEKRKEILQDMAKETQVWQEELGKEFHTFCGEVTGKDSASYFEVMQVLND